MERKDHIDLFGGSILVIFAMVMGLNQVVIKVVNEGIQPVFKQDCAHFLPFLWFGVGLYGGGNGSVSLTALSRQEC